MNRTHAGVTGFRYISFFLRVGGVQQGGEVGFCHWRLRGALISSLSTEIYYEAMQPFS